MTSELKPCSHCGETKPLTEYHRDKHASNGRKSACKVCTNALHAMQRRMIRAGTWTFSREPVLTPKERQAREVEYARRYREKNREKVRAYMREYMRAYSQTEDYKAKKRERNRRLAERKKLEKQERPE
ncbi:hypothetical protein [Azospirillum sp. sgz301742]